MIVRELITRMGFGLDQASLNNVEKGTQRVKDRANEAASAFRNVVVAFASVATVRAIINIADEMQNVRSRIAQLPQTIGDVGEAFDEISKRASSSGVSISAYARLYTRVGFAAKDYIKTQEDLLGITDTVSRALLVGGASTQEASAVMTQFSQALASGVLQGDEFRSMAEAAPQYLDKLSEAMKIPREQLKKMASEGKLTAKAVIEATRTMSGYFDNKFKQMPMTVGRAMTVIGNRFARMLDKMNRDTNFVTIIANAILFAFDKIEAGVEALVKAFGGWENTIRFVGIAIGVAFGAKALTVLSAFRIAGLAAMLPFLKMIAIITLVTLAIEDLYMWIQGGDSVIGNMIGPWAEWSDFVLGALNVVINTFKFFGNLIAAIGAALVGIFTFDFALFKEGVKGFAAHMGKALGFSADVTGLSPTVNSVGPAQMTGGPMGAGAPNVTGLSPTVNSVGPAQMTGGPMGAGAPNVQSNTTVKVTVPPGTSAEQAMFLEKSAAASFKRHSDNDLARTLSVYAP